MLLELRDIELAYGTPALFQGVTIQIDDGERVCLVGRNGAGKSTLMKVIAKDVSPDDGHVKYRDGARISRLRQEVPEGLTGTVLEVVTEGLGEVAAALAEYQALSTTASTDADFDRMGNLQQTIERLDGWTAQQSIDTVMSRLNLDPELSFDSLSGGQKRRVLLAQALVSQPHLLLLDEPTNHLDIDSIKWLEEFLLNYTGAILFITHDRSLLRKLATRIVEIDRGQATSWPGDYDNYLRRREERLHAEELENQRFDKKMAEEEIWIRQGIKARRTRNEGRVRRLKAMRDEFSQRQNVQGRAKMTIQSGERSGKIVCEAENISYAWNDKGAEKVIVQDLSVDIMRGDKIGIIGPNGVGKTTLLKILLGQLEPQSGKIKTGTKMDIAYFDQTRAALDDTKTAAENVGEGTDSVTVNGKTKHVIGYLSDFLFPPERARAPIRKLSGGERNRLMLAKLFAKSFNILVMDEPTNDLDIESLELLEELLMEFDGTLLLVSHDRAFIDAVVTSTLVFEGEGRIGNYVGGYDDWLRQRAVEQPAKKGEPKPAAAKPKSTASAAAKPKKKLSYKEQRELDELPEKLEAMENELEAAQAAMASPDFYQQDKDTVLAEQQRVAELQSKFETAFERWEELDSMS